jgi:hypothetical protein
VWFGVEFGWKALLMHKGGGNGVDNAQRK